MPQALRGVEVAVDGDPLTRERAVRTVLVTGAATGIGEGVARAFAARGAAVVLVDVDRDGLERVAADLDGGVVAPVDVTDSTALEELVADVRTRIGPVDGLVVAAGGYKGAKAAWEITDEEWDRVVDLNLTGAFKTARAIIPGMKELGWGRIIMVSSATGRMPTATAASALHYAAAKAGMIGLVRQLALELGPFGITVNAVAPGTTWTPRVERMRSPESLEQMKATIPLGRIATVQDQVGPILFLASDAAAYMTGVVLDVNGGRIMV